MACSGCWHLAPSTHALSLKQSAGELTHPHAPLHCMACRPPTVSAATYAAATVAPPATGNWAAFKLAVCRQDTPTTCLAGLDDCKRASATEPATSCPIKGATPGVSYTVQAAACPDEACAGVLSVQSALAGAPTFLTPYP